MANMKDKTLILNKNWTPIAATPIKRAVKIVSRDHGKIIDPDTWMLYGWSKWLENAKPISDERKLNLNAYIRTSSIFIPIPEIVVLSGYGKMPPMGIHFTRMALYERDNYTCQYCGKFGSKRANLTMDHVVPKSKGGHTTWENCVTCCRNCNQKKADMLLNECSMQLRRKPYRPKSRQLVLKTKHVKDSWKSFLSDEHIPTE